MSLLQDPVRLVTDDQLVEAIRMLLAKGVRLDEIPWVLAALAPFDADLLAEHLARFARET